MSILVLEGADGTGKTFLAKALEKRGFEYRHQGPPAAGTDLFELYTQELLYAQGKDVVFDRLHVGELIYGPVMRGKSLISLEQFRLINQLLFSLGGKIIFCDTDNETIIQNYLARKNQEYLTDREKLYKVIYDYRVIFDQEFTHENCLAYDYQKLSGQLLIRGGL
jgi:thymidylate kinase